MFEQVSSVASSSALGMSTGGKPADAPAEASNVFAKLLDLLGGKAGTDGTTPPDASGLAAIAGDAAAAAAAAPVAKAPAAVEAAPAAQTLKALVADLTTLKQSLGAGEEPGADLLARIKDELQQVAGTLADAERKRGAVDGLSALAGLAANLVVPGLGGVVSAVANSAGDAVAGVGAPTATPAPLAALAEKLRALAGDVRAADPALADGLEAFGKKLADGKLPADALAKLGFAADGSVDADVDAAIKAFVAADRPPPPQPAAAAPAVDPKAIGATEPALANAQLKAPDAAAAPPSDKPGAAAPASLQSDAKPEAKTRIEAKAEARNDTPARTAAAETAQNDAAADLPAKAADATQATAPGTGQQAQTTGAAAAAKALPPPYQTPQVNVPQLAFEMARQIQGGNSRFQIRLDPPELGRIDVHMHIDGGGNLSARLTVERSETLDLLQRDQRGLERALAQAGVDGGKTNLEFSLRQHTPERQQGGGQTWTPQARAGTPAVAETTPAPIVLYRGTASPGGVNLFV